MLPKYDHAVSKDTSDSSNQQSGDSGQTASSSEQSGGGSQEQGQAEVNPAARATPLLTIRSKDSLGPKPHSASVDQGRDTGGEGESKGKGG